MDEKKYKLEMQGREHLEVWGVEDVDSFDDDKIIENVQRSLLQVHF